MEFQARIFVKVSNPGARIAELFGPPVIGSILLGAVFESLKVPEYFTRYCLGLMMDQLGQMFRIFYERRISFHECNRGGQIFLFRQVRSKREMEEIKARYGYL